MTNGKGDESADKNRVARDYAFSRLEQLELSDLQGYSSQDVKEVEEAFHSSQLELLVSLSKGERDAEMEISRQFQTKVKSIKQRLINVESKKDEKPVSTVSAKLPKINIKPFDGKIENWVSFVQIFDSLIHKRDIPPVEKLHYLLSSVQGDAYNLIKNYPLSDENYILAYNNLRSHYNQKRLIASTFYEKLLTCEPSKTRSSSDLNRIHRTFRENIEILSKFNLPDTNFMLFHLLWSKLDPSTKEAFELQLASNSEIPDFYFLFHFIEKRSHALENSMVKSSANNIAKPSTSYTKPPAPKNKSSLIVPPVVGCALCSATCHKVDKCPELLKLSPSERFAKIKEKRLCILCFQPSHTVKLCKAKSSVCEKCSNRHHTLLHFDSQNNNTESQVESPEAQPSAPSSLAVSGSDTHLLFATAVVRIKNNQNQFVPIRIVLDNASACNIMSQKCANKLGLEIQGSKSSVHGVGRVSSETLGSVSCEIIPFKGDHTSPTFSLNASVMPQIVSEVPTAKLDISLLDHIKDLDLADPHFFKPGPVDMLVSVQLLAQALLPGFAQGTADQPIALRTVFGWIVMGACAAETGSSRSRSRPSVIKDCLLVSNMSLDNNIKRFWELENINNSNVVELSKSEMLCENYMETSYHRNSEGKMVVPLTFENPQEKPVFSNTREIALRRFFNLEKKFKLNPRFHEAYVKYMLDYLESGHMEEVLPPSKPIGHYYYVPQFGILRDSVTTPLRPVCDASCPDSSGLSLNNTLLPGPKLQKNIFDLLIRFRWHAVVFTGDIKQMYRQFLVDLEDCEYQRIVWRPTSDEPVKDYRLLTVTFGVSCAPYQALWCISKLAKEFSSRFPKGATVLARDIYVDDVVSGADSVAEAQLIRQELVQILSSAHLPLRKWTSNNSQFLEDVVDSDLYSEQFRNFEDFNDISLKILGLSWLPKDDNFVFKTSSNIGRCTKRSILSDIARIFDPLGLLSPVVFLAKYLMQLLWLSGVDWDSEVPESIAQEWHRFKSQLPSLDSLTIPRRMVETFASLQLHGFCDASERGYCAVIYCRVVTNDGAVIVRLCCAKSKVAPLRRCSIPRLELLAAVLLSDLVASFVAALKEFYTFASLHAWSDSTVALTWIRSCPSKWKTFVANRVAHIQENIPPQSWHHVAGFENPADCGSRGLFPADIIQNRLWWAGPTWLSHPQESWPESELCPDQTAFNEQKIYSLFTATNLSFIEDILHKYSSLTRILRVLGYCFRYLHNLQHPSSKNLDSNLSSKETNAVLLFLVKHVQEQTFASEIRCLSKDKPDPSLLPKPFRKLSVFKDELGLLRVGGRLSKGDLAYDVKHQILLPRDHRLTRLIIEEYHQRFMHPGPLTLQNLLAQEFWILSSKRAVRAVTSSCMKCFRANPRVASPPVMGNLPAFRISQAKAFSTTAVDNAGPFDTCTARGRGLRTFKSYICVFVCTATRATHLELVSELTSEAYIAALQRFVSRRGRCSRLISDQGRNFIGAYNIFRELMVTASRSEHIDFVFNPPGSPHFSGLAEACVKSVKTHLTRAIGAQRLTYEEFYTVLTQVEAMLNSRPLSPMSTDPNDFSVLTPGHFLTMEPLTILPERKVVDAKVSVLHRWTLLKKIHQDFWRKWHLEYLHTLQQRQKWFTTQNNISVGTLVLLVNEQCSPMKWKIGRIAALHPGADGVCRVVTVRTASGEYRRPVVKLCPLPLEN